jgi:hypothetical protein
MAAKRMRKQEEKELDPAVAQVVARHAMRFARDVRLMTDPEFLDLNRRGLESIARGEPGTPWEEFLRQRQLPRA